MGKMSDHQITQIEQLAEPTSAPWEWHEDTWNGGFSGLFGPNGEDVVVPQHCNEADDGAAWFEEIKPADAALIKAAPAMLDALKFYAEKGHYYDGHAGYPHGDSLGNITEPEPPSIFNDEGAKARAVIAGVTGVVPA